MSNPRLKEEGFTDFIYARLLKQKKVARVLNQPEERSDDLKEYLSKHPKLSWVHAIGADGTLPPATPCSILRRHHCILA